MFHPDLKNKFRALPGAIQSHDSCPYPVLPAVCATAGTNDPQNPAGLTGSAHQVTISKDDTIVLDGAGDKSAITERCDQIRESAEASTSDYDRCAARIISTTISSDKQHRSSAEHHVVLLLFEQLSS